MSLSPPLKRRRITQERSISPPPIHRKTNHDHVATPAAVHPSSSSPSTNATRPIDATQPRVDQTISRFEIISWNVNGISHLLPPSNHNITSFFGRNAAASRWNATDVVTDSESQSEIEELERPTCSNDGNKKEKGISRAKWRNKGTQNCSPIRAFLKRHNFPQIVCLQEVKISPSDEALKTRFERAVNPGTSPCRTEANSEPRYDISYSLPRDRFNARGPGGKGKVYGVCTLVRTDIFNSQDTITPVHHNNYNSNKPDSSTESNNRKQTEAHRKTGPKHTISSKPAPWDLEGRVLTTTIPHLNLTVLNGYWVNGTSNRWRDSSTGAIIGTRHDAKREFHRLMLLETKKHQQAGREVVLVGDMNLARDERDGYPGIRLGVEHVKNRADFNGKFFGLGGRDDTTTLDGVDTFRHVHGDRRGYTYHGERAEEWGRSCDRVDLGIVSRGLVERGVLVGADIWESVEERGGSDHVPIGVDLDVGLLEAGGGRRERRVE